VSTAPFTEEIDHVCQTREGGEMNGFARKNIGLIASLCFYVKKVK